MAGTFVELSTIGIDQAQNKLRRLKNAGENLEPAFFELGELLLESTRQRMDKQEAPDGTPWQPLSETTQQLKGHDTVLKLSHSLYDLLNYQIGSNQLMLGSPLEYAATHQFGREGGGFGGSDIPERAFLGISDQDEIDILDVINDHFENVL